MATANPRLDERQIPRHSAPTPGRAPSSMMRSKQARNRGAMSRTAPNRSSRRRTRPPRPAPLHVGPAAAAVRSDSEKKRFAVLLAARCRARPRKPSPLTASGTCVPASGRQATRPIVAASEQSPPNASRYSSWSRTPAHLRSRPTLAKGRPRNGGCLLTTITGRHRISGPAPGFALASVSLLRIPASLRCAHNGQEAQEP